MSDPKPSIERTYKRADGELIHDYAWVTDLDDLLDDDDFPVELIEETWERTEVRRFWHKPQVWGFCEIQVKGEPCDEDGVAWWQTSQGFWLTVCAEHRESAGPDGDGGQ